MTWIDLVAQRRPSAVPPGTQPPENAADWYRIENNAADADSTDVFVYDTVGGWCGLYADDFVRDLRGVATKNINLRLNSPGGSVFEGIAIANAIRSHPANVTVYVDALAASIASVIALAGNKLIMQPQSQLMVHDASGGCHGNAAEMEYMRNLLDKQSDNIAAAYAAAAGGTTEEWRARMRDETWYTAQEAVDAGLADEVMPIPEKESTDADAQAQTPVYTRMQAAWDLTAYKYQGRDQAPAPAASDSDDIVNSVTETVSSLTEGEAVIKIDWAQAATDEAFLDLVRKTVRDSMPSPPEEDVENTSDVEDESGVEDATEDVEDESAETTEPEDAKKKTLPPWLKEDDDEKSDDDDSKKSAKNSDDDWDQLVANLSVSSLSADDAFNALKEAL